MKLLPFSAFRFLTFFFSYYYSSSAFSCFYLSAGDLYLLENQTIP